MHNVHPALHILYIYTRFFRLLRTFIHVIYSFHRGFVHF